MRKLIITAHDFGLCHSVNEGIEYVLDHPNSIITELALLPNAPGSLEAAEISRKLNISVSLNLNLTTFKPLSRGLKTLVDRKGNFKKVDIRTWDFSSFDEANEEEIEKEIEAQWDWFLKNTGKKPTAILSRKNEYGDPKVLVPTIEIAKREDVVVRSPVWRWRENYGAQSYVEQEGIRMSDHVFVGLLDWQGRFGYDLEEDVDKLIEDINKKEGVSELLIFAGFVDEELFRISSVNWQRGQFLSVINKSEIIGRIKKNFDLISYKDLETI